jgi:hypothetical protein
MAVVQVSRPVAKIRLHCSDLRSHMRMVGLFPPTTTTPLSCIHDITKPDPRLVSAISGSAVKEVAMQTSEVGVEYSEECDSYPGLLEMLLSVLADTPR